MRKVSSLPVLQARCCSLRLSDSAAPWTAVRQASLSFSISWSLLRSTSIQSVVPSNHLILCHPLLLLPSVFPSIKVCSVSRLFPSGSQGIGASASASVFPMHIQYRFPLGWTGLISLPLKSLLQHHSWKASVLWHSAFCHGPTLTSILDCWRNHSFDYTDLCQQSDASAF